MESFCLFSYSDWLRCHRLHSCKMTASSGMHPVLMSDLLPCLLQGSRVATSRGHEIKVQECKNCIDDDRHPLIVVSPAEDLNRGPSIFLGSHHLSHSNIYSKERKKEKNPRMCLNSGSLLSVISAPCIKLSPSPPIQLPFQA